MQNNTNISIFVSETENDMNKKQQHIWILFLLTGFCMSGIPFEIASRQKFGAAIQTIVIDPGHGGQYPGAVYGKVREKEIVLDVALKLGNYTKNAFPDVYVIYIRERNVFVPLFQRAAIANKNDADLFISIRI